MARQVVTERDAARMLETRNVVPMTGGVAAAPAPAPPPTADAFKDRLLKYIPAEVVAVYVFIEGVLRAAQDPVPVQALQWAIFAIMTAGTWLYLVRVQKVTRRQQLLISTVAFAVWVFSLGGPFAGLSWYSPIYGAILLPLYTFGVAIVEAQE